MAEPTRVDITPNLTPEQGEVIEQADKDKNEAAYQLVMLMKRMLNLLPLRRLVEDYAKKDLDEPELAAEFFGETDDCGCPDAAGMTLKQILDQWDAANDRLMNALRGKV